MVRLPEVALAPALGPAMAALGLKARFLQPARALCFVVVHDLVGGAGGMRDDMDVIGPHVRGDEAPTKLSRPLTSSL